MILRLSGMTFLRIRRIFSEILTREYHSCLAQCLLKRDFALNKLELPEDRLCPMIPNRIDYILWIQDVIDTSSCDILSEIDRTRQVVGIDM